MRVILSVLIAHKFWPHKLVKSKLAWNLFSFPGQSHRDYIVHYNWNTPDRYKFSNEVIFSNYLSPAANWPGSLSSRPLSSSDPALDCCIVMRKVAPARNYFSPGRKKRSFGHYFSSLESSDRLRIVRAGYSQALGGSQQSWGAAPPGLAWWERHKYHSTTNSCDFYQRNFDVTVLRSAVRAGWASHTWFIPPVEAYYQSRPPVTQRSYFPPSLLYFTELSPEWLGPGGQWGSGPAVSHKPATNSTQRHSGAGIVKYCWSAS